MLRISRASWLTLTGLGFLGCTTLTSVDWSLIPPAAGGTDSAGSSSMAGAGATEQGGEPAGGQRSAPGGAPGLGGAGEAGYGGEVGGAPETGGTDVGGSGGGGNGGGGNGGMSGGGNGGSAGNGGGGGSGGSGAVVCETYPVTQPITNFTGKIVLYDGGTKPANGPFGGRAGLDNICKTAATTLGLTKKTVHALIIASDTGERIVQGLDDNFAITYNMPLGAAIVSKFGISLATSWDEFAGRPATSLICAGVVPASVSLWLTGATLTGTYQDHYNCNNWTLGTFTLDAKAWAGRTNTNAQAFQNSWLSDRWVTCDNTTAHVLCMAWGD